MTRTKPDPAAILDAILERAPKLHAAGIKSLSFEGLSVELGTPTYWSTASEGELDREIEKRARAREGAAADDPADTSDPMNDPATYPGGRVPGYQRPKKEQS